jgi:hypothetical protein
LAVPKRLLERESNFVYEVLERSGEVSAKVVIGEPVQPAIGASSSVETQSNNTFIFTEMQKAELQITNESYKYGLKNGYAVCSHPMIFGFSRMRLFDKVERGGKFTLPLVMRASLMQTNEIKFLIRYEVDIPTPTAATVDADGGKTETMGDIHKQSRFRFCRVLFNIESLYAFTPKRHVHLSTKKANEYIFNIQIVDNLAPGTSFYQTPQIDAVEIVNKRGLWTLRKKDDRGQFFIIIPTTNNSGEAQAQSMLTYRDNAAHAKSIFEVGERRNYFEQE